MPSGSSRPSASSMRCAAGSRRPRSSASAQRSPRPTVGFRVIDEKRKEGEAPISEATIMVEVDGEMEHAAAMGNGPVNALDQALRRALTKFYPALKTVELLDYKVRVLSSGEGTGASVRVLIESGDGKDRWGTVGVSHNVIEASWQALVDSIDYKLYKERRGAHRRRRTMAGRALGLNDACRH